MNKTTQGRDKTGLVGELLGTSLGTVFRIGKSMKFYDIVHDLTIERLDIGGALKRLKMICRAFTYKKYARRGTHCLIPTWQYARRYNFYNCTNIH